LPILRRLLLKRLLALLPIFVFALSAPAQTPTIYAHASRVTWVVENIDKARPAWTALGLTDIHEYPNIALSGTYQGKPVTIYAWQITGRIGGMTVDMIQPAEGQLNAYEHFLGHHGDGIFSIVYRVPNRAAMDREIARMKSKQVGLLQQTTRSAQHGPITTAYFDTEQDLKFSVGLTDEPDNAAPADLPQTSLVPAITQIGVIARAPDTAFQFWAHNFNSGQDHSGFTLEWNVPTTAPVNSSAHTIQRIEGVRFIAFPVADLDKSVTAFEHLGYHVTQSGTTPGDKPMHFAFISTNTAGGVAIELAHTD